MVYFSIIMVVYFSITIYKLMADDLTAAQCINNITGLAEALTLKVEESADFDPEYSLQ